MGRGGGKDSGLTARASGRFPAGGGRPRDGSDDAKAGPDGRPRQGPSFGRGADHGGRGSPHAPPSTSLPDMLAKPDRPEAWLRGPVPEIAPALQPVAHSLIQLREDLPPLLESLTPEQLWARPGGSASIGYHAIHLAGTLDRLATYARGDALNEMQVADLKAERAADTARPPKPEIVRLVTGAIDAALLNVGSYFEDDLYTHREVGRAKLPSTTIGLLFHAAEH